MDCSEAHLIARDGDCIETTIIKSDFSHHDKEETSHRCESTMCHKEQHLEAEYYKKIGQIILKYDDVIVFGPNDAKLKFINILDDDALFDKIRIDVKKTDKMNENQEMAFVKQHFKFYGLRPTI